MEKFSDIAYKRPDFAALKKQLNACLDHIKKAASYEEMRAAYIEVLDVMSEAETMSSVCYIRNTMDKTDKFYEDEQKAIAAGGAKLAVTAQKVSKALVSSPFRADFDKEFGPFILQNEEIGLKLMKPSIVPDMVRESLLGQAYSKDVALCKTMFLGEECNFYGLLKHMQSTDRDERRDAFREWAKMYEGVSAKLDKTYDKLVRLRCKMARKLGFKSYIDYVYLARGRYDYNAEDAARFRNEVRDVVVPVCKRLYDEQKQRLGVDELHWYDEELVFPEGNALPLGDKDTLVAKASAMYHDLSPESGEYFDFMTEHGLFDLETRPGKHLGGYCTFLPAYKAPFIFSNFNGTSADVDVLTHEAGHAFQAYVASRTLPLASETGSTSEINEIHSMSMEHFAYPYMESFFGDKADRYRYAHLCSALTTVPYLVAVDEFQHRVFEKPSMSATERRKTWRDIEKTYLPWRDYDGNDFLENGGFWMQKQHIFLYPFYYIDYALAEMCALQFFLRSRTDRKAAWEGYMKLLRLGGSKGYFDLLKEAGLDNPFAPGTVKNVVGEVEKVIAEFKEKIGD